MRAQKSDKVQTMLRLILVPTAVLDFWNSLSLSFYILTVGDIGHNCTAFVLTIMICSSEYLSPAGSKPTSYGS